MSKREDVSGKNKWCEPGVRCKENGNRKDRGEDKMKDERETGGTERPPKDKNRRERDINYSASVKVINT